MNIRNTIILTLLSLIATIHCKQKDPRTIAAEELQKRMEPTRLELEGYKKKPIVWEKGESDKDKCIRKFLESLRSNSQEFSCVVSDTEWKESYLPYVYGTGTILDGTPLDQYIDITKQRKDIGIQKISKILQNNSFSIKSITWKKSEKTNYGPFNGWKPVIVLSANRNEFVINEIKQVIEYKGLYKIAVIAP